MKNKEKTKKPVSRHLIRAKLQDIILSGQVKPGCKLLQKDLAREFGVSQSVIREALFELEGLGLVESVDNKGMFVKNLGEKILLDSLDIRKAHEALAVRLCCVNASRTQIQELIDLAKSTYELIKKGNKNDIGLVDVKIHKSLLALSGNDMLIRLSENYALLRKIMKFNRDPKQVAGEHIAILQAIIENKSDKAEKLISEHIDAAKNELRQQIKKGIFKPKWIVQS